MNDQLENLHNFIVPLDHSYNCQHYQVFWVGGMGQDGYTAITNFLLVVPLLLSTNSAVVSPPPTPIITLPPHHHIYLIVVQNLIEKSTLIMGCFVCSKRDNYITALQHHHPHHHNHFHCHHPLVMVVVVMVLVIWSNQTERPNLPWGPHRTLDNVSLDILYLGVGRGQET